MYGLVFKLFVIAIGVVMIGFAAANVFRNARRLDKRIAEFKAEQEELQQQGIVMNPYAGLAELYSEEPQPKRPPRRTPKP